MAVIDTLTAKVRNYLKKTGDAMISGDLTLFQDPTEDLHAVTKQYVDDQIAASADSWGRQDYQPHSQWGRRSAIGAASTNISGYGMLHSNAVAFDVGAGTGVASRASTAAGHWIQGTTGTNAGAQEAGAAAFVDACRRAQLPIWKTRIQLGQIGGTGWNAWFGLSDVTSGVTSPQNGVNPNTLHCAGFRYFTTPGDTTWFAVSGNATAVTGQTTDTTVVVAALTTYELMIDMSTVNQIDYYINDVLVHTETGVLPGNNNNMGVVSVIRRNVGVADRSMRWMGDTIRNTINL